MIDWQRRRLPEDVPTPVAVAVSDFCRRAKSPAPSSVVREALSLLAEEDDFRVKALADDDPPAAPLGPFAVIDVVRGADPGLAAQRQQTGYYDMVRAVAEERARAAPLPVSAPVLARVVPFPPVEAPRPKREKKAKGPSLAEKIAPRRRAKGDRLRPEPLPVAPPATAYLPRRNLPAPRGRFTRLDPARASFHALLKPDGLDTLSALVEQVPHRVALWRTLSQGYQGRGGAALTVADVEGLLDKHRLRDRLAAKERDALLAAVVEQKGAFGKAAKSLGMRPKEFDGLLKELRVGREAKELKERAIRDALAGRNLAARLELTFKVRYLEDLGIEEKFKERLQADLLALVDEAREEATSAPALVELLARRHALPADPLRRALDALGLLDPTPNPSSE